MAQWVKSLPANAGDTGDADLIPGLGISPGGGNDTPLQYSCLENSMDRGACWATVYGVTKSQTQLSTHTPHSLVHLTDNECFEDIHYKWAYLSRKHFSSIYSTPTPFFKSQQKPHFLPKIILISFQVQFRHLWLMLRAAPWPHEVSCLVLKDPPPD